MKKSLEVSKKTLLVPTEKLRKKEWYKHANISYFSKEETKKLLEELIYEPYYEALYATLYETAARVSELLDIRVKDFHQDNRTLAIKTLKQRGSVPVRVIKISEQLAQMLAQSVVQKQLSPEDSLFCREAGQKPVSRQSVYIRFKKLVLATLGEGYQDRVNPHTLRHSRAIHFLSYSKNSNIALLSKFLGHSHISNTMIYLRYTNKEMDNTLDELNHTLNLFG